MIRRAIEKDIPKIIDLLMQVCLVHHNGRPDIFNVGTKYSQEELKALLKAPISSVQFSRSVVSDSLRPHEPQHARPPCPSPTPGVYPNSCPLSR